MHHPREGREAAPLIAVVGRTAPANRPSKASSGAQAADGRIEAPTLLRRRTSPTFRQAAEIDRSGPIMC